jgi:hypothetical protein
VDSSPATTPNLAPTTKSRPASIDKSSAFWLERLIGRNVAAAAAALAEAVAEYQDGGLVPRTKSRAGELIALLFRLQQYAAGILDFNCVAREYGAAALRAACGDELSPRKIDVLIDEVLSILDKVIRENLN